MVNPYRVVSLVVLSALSWGLVSFWEPRQLVPAPGEAPLLGALYAAPVEEVETHVLRRGETLSGVLGRAQITGRELANLLLVLREYKSPRDLRESTEVTVRRWVTDGAPRAVDVRLNADSTVRLDHGSYGWASHVMVTPTTVDTVFLAGVVEAGRTVYESVVDNDELSLPLEERGALVYELAEIYAYKLDFSHDIQPGDRFRLVYEREARPDGTTRRGRILVAELENRGSSYSGIYFNPLGHGGGYYDREARSLRTAFRRYPVAYPRITSSFAWKRYHPILGLYRAHLGTDFGAGHGTPVMSTGDGVVVSAGRSGGYGNLVVIRHPGGYTTRYAHLSRFAGGIRPGRAVEQGKVIGYVGSTGLATGPHLHYELRKGDRPLDVRTAKLPGAPPIPRELRDEFQVVLGERLALFERIDRAGPRLAEAPALQAARLGGGGI